MDALSQSFARFRSRVVRWMIAQLVKDRPGYTQRFPYEVERLRRVLKPGDVLLVEGRQRISAVIKYLTQSSWSHAALYVGDAPLNLWPEQADELRAKFGDDATSLMLEANVEEGVCLHGLSKYASHDVRICRPIKLRTADRDKMIAKVLSQLGTPYDVRQILDLARYFFPVSLIPSRFRRLALVHAGEVSKKLICSSQIAMAFQEVRYPILPTVAEIDESAGGGRTRWRFMRPRLFDDRVLTPCNPMLVTPRDFDLSPYFEIVKMGSVGDFDYKRLRWTEAPAASETATQEPLPATLATPTEQA